MRALSFLITLFCLPLAFSADLPSETRWREHISNDIMPYWMHVDARGKPPGDFPSIRCRDGSAYDPGNPCPDMATLPGWIAETTHLTFTRMQARQTYTYGVGFHMTGDPEMLALMKTGVDFLRQNLIDRETGSVIGIRDKGKAVHKPSQRTTQDLAYALVGLSFYYYLTRDEAVLADILKVQRHIMDFYWNRDWGMLMWVKEDAGPNLASAKELVAQLDQINGYLLLLSRITPEPHRKRLHVDLAKLCRVLVDHFHDAKEQRFYGTIQEESGKAPWARHGDFGHTIKAYWMLFLSGKVLKDKELTALGEKGMRSVLERAYFPPGKVGKLGRWANGLDQNGNPSFGLAWWAHAELDQAAATLSMLDRGIVGTLEQTYKFWFEHFVDKEHGSVWMGVGWDYSPWRIKSNLWKNGYHEAEHALIAMICGQAFRSQPLTLYFAFPKEVKPAHVLPYFYAGKASVGNREKTQSGPVVRVRFTDLGLP
ncbi:MAG: AGE family epimerase/isomerase [Acidobacteriota bacterium]|nr:AGE family epimerase/isomerase [Acidobacteriota bacterium]